MALAAKDNTGLPALTIVGWFSLLPSPEYAVDSVAPAVCHLAAAGCTSATHSEAWGRTK